MMIPRLIMRTNRTKESRGAPSGTRFLVKGEPSRGDGQTSDGSVSQFSARPFYRRLDQLVQSKLEMRT
jgi:hypothetical protein